jgi:hypothetical protein
MDKTNGSLRYSPQQRQENISRKQFEAFLEEHEWITGDISPDMGEDILVRIYEDGVSTGLSFYVQLKSVATIEDHLLKLGDISYPFKVKDLEHWEAQTVAVVLGVWDVEQQQGWWLWIGDAVQFLSENNPEWRSKDKVNVHIPFKNALNEDSLPRLRHLLAKLYYPVVSKDRELIIQARFVFPQTEQGKDKLAELQEHFATGAEVELDGEYIEAFDPPQWWTRLFGKIDPTSMYLKIGPSKPKGPVPTQVDFISETTEEHVPYVELWNVKQGEEEITLTNEQQDIPVEIVLVLNKAKQQNRITVSTSFEGLDSVAALQVLNVQQALALGGEIRVTFLDTQEVLTIPVPQGTFAAPESGILDLIEKASLIQEETGVELLIPEDGKFAKQDFHAADELVSVIKTGRYRQDDVTFSVTILKPGIAVLLEKWDGESPISFKIVTPESYVEILSQRMDLGPMVQTVSGNWEMTREELYVWFEEASDDDSMSVHLVNVEMVEEFENWL